MVTILDTLAEIDVFIALKLIAIDFLEPLFINNNALIAIVFQISSYTLFTQFYIHFGIAINRFYIAFTTTKKLKWNLDFVQAMIVLMAQFAMAFQQSGAMYGILHGNIVLNQWFNGNYIYFQNALNLTGPISLMIVGKQIRKDYFEFIFGKRMPSTIPTILTTTEQRNFNSFTNSRN
uniref:Serpentine receptor class gamma n=1 Tax=Panagrolaimus davidi TaxID=227884 RepID=A0A914QML6_9BILA